MKGNAKICKNSHFESPFGGIRAKVQGSSVSHIVRFLLVINVARLLTVRRSYNFATGSFHTQKLCSRLLWTEVEFYWQKQQNRVLCHPSGDLGVTYTVHLWLVGKRVVDFILVPNELFPWAITRHCLRDRTFSRFGAIPASDRRTDRQTDTHND